MITRSAVDHAGILFPSRRVTIRCTGERGLAFLKWLISRVFPVNANVLRLQTPTLDIQTR